MKRIITLFLCFVMLLSVTGCGGEITNGSDMNLSISASPATLDPQLASEVTCDRLISLCMATLFTYDKNGKLVPQLAEKYEMSKDGLTYTFHMKKDLVWSDGRPLTANDFVFAMQRLADSETGSNAVYLITDCCRIKNAEQINAGKMHPDKLGVSAPDDRTVVFELEVPCPYFISLLAGPVFSPCNEKFFNSCKGEYATEPDKMLYCGAYRLDRYEPLAAQIHFSLNEKFFDPVDGIPEGINVQVVGNTEQAVMCYNTGQFDVSLVSGDVMSKLAGNKDLKEISDANIMFIQFGNLPKSDVNNVHIRRALSHCIDRDSIVKDVIKAGAYAWNRVSPKDYYYETNGKDFSGDEHRYDKEAGYDLNEAKKEWEQGCKELGKKNVELTLSYSNTMQTICEVFKQEWEEALPGLKIKMKSLPVKEWLTALNTSAYDMIFQGWTADYADPTAFFNNFITGVRGTTGYSNLDFDKMVETSGSAEMCADPDKRNKLLHQAEDLIMKDAGLITVYSSQNCFLIDRAYVGFNLTPTGCGYLIGSLGRRG